MLRCLIATLGGDAPGVNATVRAVTRLALRRDIEVYGARSGWLGLIRGQVWKLKESDVAAVLARGGSILGSTDTKIHRHDNETRERIVETLRKFDLVVVTGGMGSYAVLDRIYADHDIGLTTTMFVPASVEGEFLHPGEDFGTDTADDINAESIGMDTAANTAMDAIDRLRDQAFHSRTVFLVECVGAKSNYIPIVVGTACGAHRIYLPPFPRLSRSDKEEIKQLYGPDYDPNFVDIKELVSWVETMFERTQRSYLLVILPEGVPLVSIRDTTTAENTRTYEDLITSMKPLELTVVRVADALGIHFSGVGSVQVRYILLDDLQRGGTPSVRDRILGSLYGEAAVEEFLSVVNGIDTVCRGNLNLLAISNSDKFGWRCFPRQETTHLFSGENPRAGGVFPLPYFRQARGVVSGYRPLASL